VKRLLHPYPGSVVGQNGSIVVDAETHQRPSVIESFFYDVQFIPTLWTVFVFPDNAGRLLVVQSLRIAMTITPDTWHSTSSLYKRIISRNSSVVVNTVSLTTVIG